MKTLRRFLNRSALLASSGIALSLAATSVNALTIDATFGAGVTAAEQSVFETASNIIASLYGNPVTINIQFNTGSIGGGGESQTPVYLGSYSTYTAQLAADSAANPANTTLATAIAFLGSGNGAGNPTAGMIVSQAQLKVLGVNHTGSDGTVTLDSSLFTTPQGALPQPVALYAAEHEINEILGGGGVGSMLNGAFTVPCTQGGFSVCYGSTDLYRYDAGVKSFSQSASSPYFSVDGGADSIVSFNTGASGSDFGDFLFNSAFCLVQSAFVCNTAAGGELYNTSSPEYAMMEAIGYNPVTTPLPSTWLMLVSGLAGLWFFAHRDIRKDRKSTLSSNAA